ncbi:MAG: hydroxymethylglutaryl-CoA lyase [Ignavibacteria bacterium]|nr:hydroxymethylglutaryl-CoA lyase [Ignavibacteria bacterium]
MKKIFVHEVGPRDGLQIEKEIVPTDVKIKWINELSKSGIDIIQIGSFVNPKRMPQMADTDELFKYFNFPENKPENVILAGLVLNDKGLDRGLACGVDMFCMGVSASNTHSQKNTGMTTDEALNVIIKMGKKALEAGKKVQVSVQSAFGCGFEGKIPKEKVLNIIQKYVDAGFKNISLADTAGHAFPSQVEDLYNEVFEIGMDLNMASHFHDTFGLGMANVYAAYKSGVNYFESSFAGLGGCPFTAVSSGNVCTEDLVHFFNRMGLRNDINLESIIEVTKQASEYFKRTLPGIIHRTGKVPEIINT